MEALQLIGLEDGAVYPVFFQKGEDEFLIEIFSEKDKAEGFVQAQNTPGNYHWKKVFVR